MEENDSEEFASIPWDFLATASRPDLRRWVTLASVAAVVVALSAAAARTFWPQPAEPVAIPAVLVAETTTSTTSTTLLSEADLFGVDVDAARLAAVGQAQLFVHRYMTADGDGPHSFVESIIPVEAIQIGISRFAVVMAVRSLRASAGGSYERAPDVRVEVVVDVGESGPRVVDWPGPPLEMMSAADPDPSGLNPAIPPPTLAAKAAGIGGGEPISVETDGSYWRFLFDRTDEAGITRPVTVWLNSDGMPVPAGGFQP